MERLAETLLRGLQATGLRPVLVYDLESAGETVVVAVVSPDQPLSGWAALSDRERDVARLAGSALTNRQIARRMGISRHTVNYHLRHVYRKLSITSRVSLAPHIPYPE
ncbi:helix-turn-helix transcriptional regulator [Dactylosporangium sp. NPDC005572]|uniref:helix-turn-helix domain-containing protein n=1 Tax=Dactylosporangium sp. NPDC005572 TaxID=3156889 RepID=UPI0033B4F6B5